MHLNSAHFSWKFRIHKRLLHNCTKNTLTINYLKGSESFLNSQGNHEKKSFEYAFYNFNVTQFISEIREMIIKMCNYFKVAAYEYGDQVFLKRRGKLFLLHGITLINSF